MTAQTQLKICAYSLSLLGLWSVTVTDHFSTIWPVLTTIMVLASWFYEGPRKQSPTYRRMWMLLAIGMIAFSPVDVVLSYNLLLPAVHISMFAQAYLLFNRKTTQAYQRIFVVSFAQLLASSNLTSDIVFAVILALYCIMAIYGITLLHLVGGLERSGNGKPDVEKAPPALLASSFALTALVLPLTLAFFYSAPRLKYALIANSRDVEAMNRLKQAKTRTGFTTTVQLGSFGRIQEDQTLALRVEFPEGSTAFANVRRWRGGALNIYDGTTWSSSRDYFAYYSGRERKTGFRNSGQIFPRGDELFIMDERYANYKTVEELENDRRLQKYVCYLEIPYSDNIFGVGEIKAVNGPFRFGLEQDFNRSLSIRDRSGLSEYISYTAYSEMGESNSAALQKVGIGRFKQFLESGETGEYYRIHFLQTPTSLNPRISQLANEVTKNASTPYDKVVAIQDFLENQYAYSLDLGAPSSDDPLSHFLFDRKSGHCEYFATAMTLMTRLVGIPARLVKGFQKGEWNEEGRFFEVRQRNAHVWVEVFFPDYGWVEFDPSPRAVADVYLESQRSPIARALTKRFLALQIIWRKSIVGYNATRRSRLLSEIKDFVVHEAPRRAAGFIGSLLTITGKFVISHLPAAAAVAAFVIAVVVGYTKGVLFPNLPWTFLGRRRRAGGAAFYEHMLGLLEKRKIAKPDCMTPLEFLNKPSVRAHPMYSDIEAVTAIYNRVRFGGHPLVNRETGLIEDILRRLKQSTARAGER
jgi:transglutaminase-like putative cysteine protease